MDPKSDCNLSERAYHNRKWKVIPLTLLNHFPLCCVLSNVTSIFFWLYVRFIYGLWRKGFHESSMSPGVKLFTKDILTCMTAWPHVLHLNVEARKFVVNQVYIPQKLFIFLKKYSYCQKICEWTRKIKFHSFKFDQDLAVLNFANLKRF